MWWDLKCHSTLARRQIDIQLKETSTRRGRSEVDSMIERIMFVSWKRGWAIKHLPLLLRGQTWSLLRAWLMLKEGKCPMAPNQFLHWPTTLLSDLVGDSKRSPEMAQQVESYPRLNVSAPWGEHRTSLKRGRLRKTLVIHSNTDESPRDKHCYNCHKNERGLTVMWGQIMYLSVAPRSIASVSPFAFKTEENSGGRRIQSCAGHMIQVTYLCNSGTQYKYLYPWWGERNVDLTCHTWPLARGRNHLTDSAVNHKT